MEKRTLPNSVAILVLGIVSIVTCCCYGIIGLTCGIVALVLAKSATDLYKKNPEEYTGYSNVKAGRIMAIIGIILNSLYIILLIIAIISQGFEALKDPQNFYNLDY